MITRKQFESDNFKGKRNNVGDHPIVAFLKKNRNYAYTANEIIKAIKMNPSTCRSMLRTLMKRKLVQHKTPFYIIVNNKK